MICTDKKTVKIIKNQCPSVSKKFYNFLYMNKRKRLRRMGKLGNGRKILTGIYRIKGIIFRSKIPCLYPFHS